MRDSGRVNASSLRMEFDIPLGSYPGRGINVPVGLSYTSKLWRLEYDHSDPRVNFPSECITKNKARYSENAASGWTTSLAVSYIEYTGEDNLFDQNGFPVNEINCPANQSGTYYRGYIKRITVHLPSGETHELRASDTPVMYPGNQMPTFDWNATFYAVDGSNLRYVENSSSGLYRLLMPDGSIYDFTGSRTSLNLTTIRKATKFSDRNGNYTTFNEPNTAYPNGYWTDTLGRIIPVPFKPEAPTAFVTEATLDVTTGLPLTTKDANGQITTIQYDPATLRVKKMIPPAGAGESETFYNDQPNNYRVKSRAQIDTDKWAESITYFDGLGRAYKSEQVNSNGNIFVEKEFDAEGRVKRVTNPFRANEAKQWTTNVYD
ncbi:MAG: hypothetical protein WA584_07725, partial [Pyrinomonadaceae bacterium]